MRISFGAGRHTPPDFFCIDVVQHPRASRPLDMLHDITKGPIPLADECADELHAYHVIEHFYQWEAAGIVMEWKRLLSPGGWLFLECPDLEKAARNLLDGLSDQMTMWPLYGDPQHRDPFMCHRWGYTPNTLSVLLQQCGFERITHCQPRTHGGRIDRDMRIEARKHAEVAS